LTMTKIAKEVCRGGISMHERKKIMQKIAILMLVLITLLITSCATELPQPKKTQEQPEISEVVVASDDVSAESDDDMGQKITITCTLLNQSRNCQVVKVDYSGGQVTRKGRAIDLLAPQLWAYCLKGSGFGCTEFLLVGNTHNNWAFADKENFGWEVSQLGWAEIE